MSLGAVIFACLKNSQPEFFDYNWISFRVSAKIIAHRWWKSIALSVSLHRLTGRELWTIRQIALAIVKKALPSKIYGDENRVNSSNAIKASPSFFADWESLQVRRDDEAAHSNTMQISHLPSTGRERRRGGEKKSFNGQLAQHFERDLCLFCCCSWRRLLWIVQILMDSRFFHLVLCLFPTQWAPMVLFNGEMCLERSHIVFAVDLHSAFCNSSHFDSLNIFFVISGSQPPDGIPKTSFSCRGRGSGYYADTETDCQAYHMCDEQGRQFDYMCPNATLFQQRMLICDHWYMVDCSSSEANYAFNRLIGQRVMMLPSFHLKCL